MTYKAPTATGSEPGLITLTGDFGGTAISPTVISITGGSGVVNIASTGNVITWAAATTAPGLGQSTPASDLATANLIFTPQAPFASASTNKTPGSVVFNFPTPVAGGNEGAFLLNRNGVTQLTITPNFNGVAAASIVSAGGLKLAGGTTDNVYINAGGSNQVILRSGSTSLIRLGDSVSSGNGLDAVQINAVTSGAANITFEKSTTPSILQASTSSGSGATFTVQAQGATGAAHNGGTLLLQAGTSGSASPGVVQIYSGAAQMITFDAANGVSLSQTLYPASDNSIDFGTPGLRFRAMYSNAFGNGTESTAIKGSDLTITPQTSTHATDQGGGNLIVALQTPTGTGVEAFLTTTRGGTNTVSLGGLVGSPGYGAVYVGETGSYTGSDYTLASNGSITYLNAPTSHLYLAQGNGIVATFDSVANGGVAFATQITLRTNVLNDATATPITTTDGTLTTIYTDSAIPASTTYDYVVTVIGINTSTQDVYRADFSFTYSRVGSAAPLSVGAAPVALNVRTSLSANTWGGASIALSTNSVLVQVTGLAATNIDWNCSVNRIKVV